jgi:hypothetical protein
MPGQTTDWALRYPLYSDVVNAAAQIQNLAVDINAALGVVDASITAAQVKRGAFIRRTVNQLIPNNAFTNLTFVTEVFDNDNMANLGVDNTALTVNTGGLYLLVSRNNWPTNAVGSRAMAYTVNGAVYTALRDETTNAAGTNQCMAMLVFCNVGDVLRVQGFQNSGGALNSSLTEFSAIRMA